MKRINKFRTAYNKLNMSRQGTMRLILLLCMSDAISLRDISVICAPDNPQGLEKDLFSLSKAGLIAILYNSVSIPEEVAVELQNIVIPADEVNACITKLSELTVLPTNHEILPARPFFSMAFSTMKYVVAHPEIDIDYYAFTKILFNLTLHYDVFGEPELSFSVHDLSIMKAITMTKEKLDKESEAYALMSSCEAYFLEEGFWYPYSKSLIDEALSILIKKDEPSSALAYTYFVLALWYKNYGKSADALYYLYHAFETANRANDTQIASYCTMRMAFLLATLNEFDASHEWLNVNLNVQTKCEYNVYVHLINALKSLRKDTVVEQELTHAEALINEINPDGAIKAKLMLVKSIVSNSYELYRESSSYYKSYSDILLQNYNCTLGAYAIWTASEVERLTNSGALVGADRLVDMLDTLQITRPIYSLSVKLSACKAYTNYFRSKNNILARTYCDAGLQYAKDAVASDEVLSYLQDHYFYGYPVPDSVSGTHAVYLFEHEQIINIIAQIPHEHEDEGKNFDIKKQIDIFQIQYPEKIGLEVIKAGLLNREEAIKRWHACIDKADNSERYDISLSCARWANAYGYIWDAAFFYELCLFTDGFRNLNKYERISILLEVVVNLERSGHRGRAKTFWEELEKLAADSSRLTDVYQQRGKCCYDHADYESSLEYYNKAIDVYKPEESVIDERLMSLYSYRATSCGNMGQYNEALASVIEAKKWGPVDTDFNLEYNHCYYLIATGHYREARAILPKIKKMAQDEDELEYIDYLCNILSMPAKEIEAYFSKVITKEE